MSEKFAVIKLNYKDAEIYEWRTYKDYGYEWYNYHDNNGNYMPQNYMHENNTIHCDSLEEAEIIKAEMNHKHFIRSVEKADGEVVSCKSCDRMYDIDDGELYEGNNVCFWIDCVCGKKVSGIISPVISARVTYD